MAGARYSVFLNRPMKRRWGEINLSVNRQNDRNLSGLISCLLRKVGSHSSFSRCTRCGLECGLGKDSIVLLIRNRLLAEVPPPSPAGMRQAVARCAGFEPPVGVLAPTTV